MKLNFKSLIVGAGAVFCSVFTAWQHAGEPLGAAAVAPIMGALLAAIATFMPSANGNGGAS